MPIIVFTGPLGSGKTYAMTHYGYIVSQYANVPAFANYAVDFATRVSTFKELKELRRAVVMIDELQEFIDSREFKREDQISRTRWLLQTRKMHLLLLGTTQDISQVDLRMRRIVDFMAQCKKFGSSGAWRTRLTMYSPVGEDVWHGFGTRVITHGDCIYELFNTDELVDVIV